MAAQPRTSTLPSRSPSSASARSHGTASGVRPVSSGASSLAGDAPHRGLESAGGDDDQPRAVLAGVAVPSNRTPAELSTEAAKSLIELLVGSDVQASNFVGRQATELVEHHDRALDHEVSDRLFTLLASSLNPSEVEHILAKSDENRSLLADQVMPLMRSVVNDFSMRSGAIGSPARSRRGAGTQSLEADAQDLGFSPSPTRGQHARLRQLQRATGGAATSHAPLDEDSSSIAFGGDADATTAGVRRDGDGIGDGGAGGSLNDRLSRIEEIPAPAAVAMITAWTGATEERGRELVRVIDGLRAQVSLARKLDADEEVERKARRRQKLHRIAVAQKEHDELRAELRTAMDDNHRQVGELRPDVKKVEGDRAYVQTVRTAYDVLRVEAKRVRDGHGEVTDAAEAGANRVIGILTAGSPTEPPLDIDAPEEENGAPTTRDSSATGGAPSHVRADSLRDRCRELGYDLSVGGNWTDRINTGGLRGSAAAAATQWTGETTSLNPAAEVHRDAVYVDPKMVLMTATNLPDAIDTIVDVADEFFDDAAVTRYLDRRAKHARRYAVDDRDTANERQQPNRPNGTPAFPTPLLPVELDAARYRELEQEAITAMLRDVAEHDDERAGPGGIVVPRRHPSLAPSAPRVVPFQEDQRGTDDPEQPLVASSHQRPVAAEPEHVAAAREQGAADYRRRASDLTRRVRRDREWRTNMRPRALADLEQQQQQQQQHADGLPIGSLPGTGAPRDKSTPRDSPARVPRREGSPDGADAAFPSLADEIRAAAARRTEAIRKRDRQQRQQSPTGGRRQGSPESQSAPKPPAKQQQQHEGRRGTSPKSRSPARREAVPVVVQQAMQPPQSTAAAAPVPGLEHFVEVDAADDHHHRRAEHRPPQPAASSSPDPAMPASSNVPRFGALHDAAQRQSPQPSAAHMDASAVSKPPPEGATPTESSGGPPSSTTVNATPVAASVLSSRSAIPTYHDLMQMQQELDMGGVGEALRELRARQDRDGHEQLVAQLREERNRHLDASRPVQPASGAPTAAATSLPGFERSVLGTGRPRLFSERRKVSSTSRSASAASATASGSQPDVLVTALRRPDGLRAQLDVMRLDAAEAVGELRGMHQDLGVKTS